MGMYVCMYVGLCVNNRLLLKDNFFWISRGKVATLYR